MLKKSHAIHDAEMAGSIPVDEAAEMAIEFNYEAISESEKALEVLSHEDD